MRSTAIANQHKLNYHARPKSKALLRTSKRQRKTMIRFGLIVLQVVIVAVVATFIVLSSKNTGQPQVAALGSQNGDRKDVLGSPLDQVSSTDVAVQIARAANMLEATAIANQADSMANSAIVPSTSEPIAPKAQVISNDLKTKSDIKRYTAKTGDTLSSLAVEFGVTSDSIRWSNNLGMGDTLTAGKVLTIPPINGLTYTVKSGDTPDALAAKYRTNKEKIISFNDAEINGLTLNQLIVIPDGSIALPSPLAVQSSNEFAWGGSSPIYGSNGYDYGQCTWWVAIRRQQIGRPVPSNLGNAITWTRLAARAGLATGNTPKAGAVIWTDPATMSSYYRTYGHVGFVEKINDDGSVWVSDMNSSGYTSMDANSGRGGGWGRTSYRLLSPEKARSFTYVY